MMPNVVHSQKGTSKSIAWIVSIGVHVGIGIVAFFITWSVIRVEEDPPRIVTAAWHEQPVLDSAKPPMSLPPVPAVEMNLPEIQPPPPKAEIQDGYAVLHTIATGGEIPELARREPETEVKFMGLDAVAAKRIIYVVDISGTMTLYFPSPVLDEVERSLRALHPKQEFGIIFFQKENAIVVPPRQTLVSANAKNIVAAIDWVKSSGKVIPFGKSNPMNAIRTAMNLKPDIIYLLSENITGAGEYEVPAEELLASLDRINPVDSRNGLRRVQINCIAFVTQDPLHTMQRIAEIHGGDDGYTFIERGRVGK